MCRTNWSKPAQAKRSNHHDHNNITVYIVRVYIYMNISTYILIVQIASVGYDSNPPRSKTRRDKLNVQGAFMLIKYKH